MEELPQKYPVILWLFGPSALHITLKYLWIKVHMRYAQTCARQIPCKASSSRGTCILSHNKHSKSPSVQPIKVFMGSV